MAGSSGASRQPPAGPSLLGFLLCPSVTTGQQKENNRRKSDLEVSHQLLLCLTPHLCGLPQKLYAHCSGLLLPDLGFLHLSAQCPIIPACSQPSVLSALEHASVDMFFLCLLSRPAPLTVSYSWRPFFSPKFLLCSTLPGPSCRLLQPPVC